MIDKLTSLQKFTKIVADTSDISKIKLYKLENATTNPSLIFEAIKKPKYQSILNESIIWAKKQSNSLTQQVIDGCDKFNVNIGLEILKLIPGRVSTEIDARFSYDKNSSIKKARRIINLYNDAGIDNNRILIKLAATWQGIQAGEQLEKEGINCNLTLIFSFAQAKACAEAGVYLISPFIGRIYDWHKENFKITKCFFDKDPGVVFVSKIYHYYKLHNYKTIIMGASFRNSEEILQLAGCDYLTISPKFLEELSKQKGEVIQKLQFKEDVQAKPTKLLSESKFYFEHFSNKMATNKLAEGIYKFFIDQKKIEQKVKKKLL